ncbi:hypothetical protein HDU81_004952 [Chytriomyces hyalinus]|nr:hypothetical protein HDU81_004952 [Chytriomyces hyalinus]
MSAKRDIDAVDAIQTPASAAEATPSTQPTPAPANDAPAAGNASTANTPAPKRVKRSTVTVEQLIAMSGVPVERGFLLETDVGISTYLNPLQTDARLTAIIKHRFTDFIVNEIDPSGNILHLTATDAAASSNNAVKLDRKTIIDTLPESVFTEMRTFFDDEQDENVERVKELVRNGVRVQNPPKKDKEDRRDRYNRKEAAKEVAKDVPADKPAEGDAPAATESTEEIVAEQSLESKPMETETKEPESKAVVADARISQVITKAFTDKQDRVRVYEFFRTHFAELLATDSRGDQKICIRLATPRDLARSTPRPDFSSTGPGEHLSFILYKENKDTMECLNTLARVTNTMAKAYTFAGTKDKRGVTVQRCSGHRVWQSKLEGVKLPPGMKVGGFKYVKDRVNLGDLSANHFIITLRDVEIVQDDSKTTTPTPPISEILATSLKSLQENGFINYYGMQRFGTRSVSTHQVGLAMLSSSWATAIELIMMPKGEERAEFAEARRLWVEEKNAKKSFYAFPRGCVAERAVMMAFMKETKGDYDYLGALMAVPRNLRMMYLHSVQSFVWNHAASERIRLHGRKIVKGDLVARYNPLSNRNTSTTTTGDDSADTADTTGDAEAAEISAIEEHRQGRMIEVDLVETDEDAATRSIDDLVLPLPGHQVKYPTNEIGTFYKTFMARYGLDPNDMKRHNREVSLAGDYRRVLIRPKNVSWKLLQYDDPHIPLSRTDLDIINGVPEPVSLPDGKRVGVVVEFSLETSSYATMALREILRSDTSAGFQGTLSNKSNQVTDAEREKAAAATAAAVGVEDKNVSDMKDE